MSDNLDCRIAKELGEPVRNIEVFVLFSTEEGASLYEVRILSIGEIRFIIESETGEFRKPFSI